MGVFTKGLFKVRGQLVYHIPYWYVYDAMRKVQLFTCDKLHNLREPRKGTVLTVLIDNVWPSYSPVLKFSSELPYVLNI